uniref:Transposable element P transposase-like RNase H domain-containing protein n=1 Tax=Clytia hemisphaerica TaxID=252671 RepID=A0A7M5V9H3_9CNID
MFDEMKIKSGLVFSRSTGTIIGFTELGKISDEIDSLERSLEKERKKLRPLATHVLAIMIRGFFHHFNLPIGFHATKSASAEQLFAIIWEAVGVLEMVNFNVHAFVCDGASANRKFFEMHRL